MPGSRARIPRLGKAFWALAFRCGPTRLSLFLVSRASQIGRDPSSQSVGVRNPASEIPRRDGLTADMRLRRLNP